MLKNQDIICISSIDWDFIWQGHQEIMSAFAANGNRVLFIENTGVRAPKIRDISRLRKRFKDYFRGVKGIREEAKNLYVYSPIVLPFPYSRIARAINKFILLSVIKRWMRAMNFANPVIWTFLPTGTAMDIIENIDKKLLVYYCIDNFAVSSASAKKIIAYEKKLIGLADRVFVTSQALYDHCARFNNNVTLFPFGVNIESFESVRKEPTQVPEELKDLKPPVIGYVGGVHKWIDFELVKYAASAHPEMQFVFVGPVQTDVSQLSGCPNIRLLGGRKHSELPNLVKHFTAAVIPYLLTEYTKNVYPTKLNEYLSMGKPVVSSYLPEVDTFNARYGGIVYIGKDRQEFSSLLSRAIAEDSDSLREKRISAASENSWKSRIELMSAAIDEAIEEKAKKSEAGWKDSLAGLFAAARRRIVRPVIYTAAALLLVFCTPAVWFLAEPLKISEEPQKADAIVVFAGGAGESGKQGQGYEERVGYAVELYKEGYAKNIVFSSGYSYAIKEVDIMKALAVSMGVPASAITLEDRSGYTYEFVKNTSDIVRRNGWKKILLVSSPYHMRRASLVYDKLGEGVDVIYTPIKDSKFYKHGFGASPRQIKGILHEYAGIVYYLIKGYI